jgi:hypothetical protein
MEIEQPTLSYGLRSIAKPSGTNIYNDLKLGVTTQQENFSDADVMYSIRAVMVGTASTLTISQETAACTFTAFVPGTAQVETLTCVGTIAQSGTAAITLTAYLIALPVKYVSVLIGDTATVWAGKVRAALAADADFAQHFTVSGATTSIILTRKSVTIGGVSIIKANDTTCNLAVANGTCTGITTANSANTILGAATTGVALYDGDGKDFEGNAIPNLSLIYAALTVCLNGGASLQNTYGGTTLLTPGKHLQSWDIGVDVSGEQFVFSNPSANPDACEVTLTILGKAGVTSPGGAPSNSFTYQNDYYTNLAGTDYYTFN